MSVTGAVVLPRRNASTDPEETPSEKGNPKKPKRKKAAERGRREAVDRSPSEEDNPTAHFEKPQLKRKGTYIAVRGGWAELEMGTQPTTVLAPFIDGYYYSCKIEHVSKTGMCQLIWQDNDHRGRNVHFSDILADG